MLLALYDELEPSFIWVYDVNYEFILSVDLWLSNNSNPTITCDGWLP